MDKIKYPNFFVTTEIVSCGALNIDAPLRNYLNLKHTKIIEGCNSRKFVFKDCSGWRIIITFFPTDRRVDERYALKNKIDIRRKD